MEEDNKKFQEYKEVFNYYKERENLNNLKLENTLHYTIDFSSNMLTLASQYFKEVLTLEMAAAEKECFDLQEDFSSLIDNVKFLSICEDYLNDFPRDKDKLEPFFDNLFNLGITDSKFISKKKLDELFGD